MSSDLKISHGCLYLADLSPRQGTEAGKVRPVLVIQTDFLNSIHHPSTWVLPCTSQISGETVLRVFVPKGLANNNEDCEIMIDQSRAIDNSRIKKRLGPLPKTLLSQVKAKLKLTGGLDS